MEKGRGEKGREKKGVQEGGWEKRREEEEGKLGKGERADCGGKNKEEDIRRRKMLKGKRGEYKKGDGERRIKEGKFG